MIIQNNENGIVCRCSCGVDFIPEDSECLINFDKNDNLYDTLVQSFDELICKSCEDKAEAEQERRERQRAIMLRLREMPEVSAAAGIPDNFRELTEPYVRWTATYLWEHRKEHLLMSGVTGVGKTTGACLCALNMLKQLKRVRYTTKARLTNELMVAKMGKFGTDSFYNKLYYSTDLLIIDEVVGKERVSDTSKELVARISDDCYSGICGTKVWLLGNFYEGSLDTLVDDPEPFKRRIYEIFNPVVCDKANQRVIPLKK